MHARASGPHGMLCFGAFVAGLVVMSLVAGVMVLGGLGPRRLLAQELVRGVPVYILPGCL